jgi:hypothetical protein
MTFTDPLSFWGSYGRYQACVKNATDVLVNAGLWDQQMAASISDAATVRPQFVGAVPSGAGRARKMPNLRPGLRALGAQLKH